MANEDRIKGKAQEMTGRAEKAAGDMTDDADMQAKGTRDQAKGQAQNVFGKAKDAVKDAVDNVTGNTDANRNETNR